MVAAGARRGDARAMAAMAALPPGPLSPPGGGAAEAAGPEGAEGLFVLLGAGLAAASHPLLYVKLLVQVRSGGSRGGEQGDGGVGIPCVTGVATAG